MKIYNIFFDETSMFCKHNRACELTEGKHNADKINYMGVPCPTSSFLPYFAIQAGRRASEL